MQTGTNTPSLAPKQVLNFADEAQKIIKAYYLKPYPSARYLGKGGIERYYHGALHAVCTTLADSIFTTFLKKYIPDPKERAKLIREANAGHEIDDETEELIKYAMLCHDAANISETKTMGGEKDHADIFRLEMKSRGFTAAKIERVANAMTNKDRDDNDIVRMRIHDGDCWEILRIDSMTPQRFDIDQLAIVKLLRKNLRSPHLDAAITEVREMVHYYHALTRHLYQDRLHSECEHAHNCVTEISTRISRYHVSNKLSVLEMTAKRFLDTKLLSQITHDDSNFLYNTELDEKTFHCIKESIFQTDEKCVVINPDTSGIHYIRQLRSANFNAELNVLNSNAAILKNTAVDAKTFADCYSASSRNSDHKELVGFRFRPMQLVSNDWRMRYFEEQKQRTYGVAINPSTVKVFFRYKDNIFSDKLKNSTFNFERPHRKKALLDLVALRKKLEEREARRRGETWDNFGKHYGNPTTAHNESLGTYDLNDITGILIADNVDSAKAAIDLWKAVCKNTNRDVPFYRYSSISGMMVVTKDEALFWAGIRMKNAPRFLPYDRNPVEQFQQRGIITDEAQLNASIYGSFYVDLITDLTCSLATHKPSKEHPISYSFTYLNYQGKAYVKDGIPVIEMAGKCYYDKKGFLPKIALDYQKQQVNNIQDKLQFHVDKSLGLENFKFALDEKPKPCLMIQYNKSLDHSAEKVLNYIGYDTKIHKWEVLTHPNEPVVIIRLPVVQAIDNINKRIESYQAILEVYFTAEANRHIQQAENTLTNRYSDQVILYRKAIETLKKISKKSTEQQRLLAYCHSKLALEETCSFELLHQTSVTRYGLPTEEYRSEARHQLSLIPNRIQRDGYKEASSYFQWAIRHIVEIPLNQRTQEDRDFITMCEQRSQTYLKISKAYDASNNQTDLSLAMFDSTAVMPRKAPLTTLFTDTTADAKVETGPTSTTPAPLTTPVLTSSSNTLFAAKNDTKDFKTCQPNQISLSHRST